MKALPSWWRRPGWISPRCSPPRVPLLFTLGTTVVFLLVPALLLRRLPRPQALGLEKLMASVSLLQSFRVVSERPVPELWRQRLGGPTAERLWRLQSRTWWQFWDGHAEGPPFLALSSRGLPEPLLRAVAVPPVRVGDLAIFPPDPLSSQMLRERLRPRVRSTPGLRQRCLPRLEREQAVFWRPIALGVLVGPLAPFLQDFQEGCLSLSLRSDGLSWTGQAASVEGMVLQPPPGALEAALVPEFRPSATDSLLEVQGRSLDRLLAGLLARELIRQPLAERYGFGRAQMALLRQTPFRLVLRPLARGPFQASIELTVLVQGRDRPWKALLERVATNLQKEGLRPHASLPPPPASPSSAAPSAGRPGGASAPSPNPSAIPGQVPKPAPPVAVWPTAFWTRPDGVVVGGWQRRRAAGLEDQISLFLGPQPVPTAPLLAEQLPARGGMRLVIRPQELALRNLLPEQLPAVVKRSGWLWFASEPVPGLGREAPLSLLQGSLVLRP